MATSYYLDKTGLQTLWDKLDERDQFILTKIASNKDLLATLTAKPQDEHTAPPEGSILDMIAKEIAKIVDNAPENFDTLKEISDWITTNPDGATALKKDIEKNKQDISSLQTTTEEQGENIEKLKQKDQELEKEDKRIVKTSNAIFKKVEYEFLSLLEGCKVYENGKEFRIMFPNDTQWFVQNEGEAHENYDKNKYYFQMRVYAPSDEVEGFKEDMATIIQDPKIYKFIASDFGGVDEYGRKYSVVWLPAAELKNGNWSYFGNNSKDGKYVGWYHTIEWYDKNNKPIGQNTIRINLATENNISSILPFFLNDFINSKDFDKLKTLLEISEVDNNYKSGKLDSIDNSLTDLLAKYNSIQSIPLEEIENLTWTSTFD